MNKLLSANFSRLKKDKLFWLCMMIMIVLAAWIIIMIYYQQMMEYNGHSYSLENAFSFYAVFIGIIQAIFCSLHIGTEYSDGSIRNKLVVGHTRCNIYLANLITCIGASLLFVLTYLLCVVMLGIPLLGFFTTELSIILLILLGSLFMALALSAIFTLLSMLIQNKASCAVIAVIGIFTLLLVAANINTALQQPETLEGYILLDEGVMESGDGVANPSYISGTQRIVFEVMMDILPTGQAFQYASGSTAHLWQKIFYSAIIFIITMMAGMFFFNKKDII